MVDKEIIGQVPKSINNFRKVNKIFNVILCIIIIPIIFVNLVMFIKSLSNKDKVPSFLGYKFFVVLTGSMEKTLNIGDFIISREVEENTLQVGDIITFKEGSTIITHRITRIEKTSGELVYTTKGDNNNIEDSTKLSKQNIEGKYLFKIPFVGKFLTFLQSIWGIIILILIPVISIITSYGREAKLNMKKTIRKSKRIAYNQNKDSIK